MTTRQYTIVLMLTAVLGTSACRPQPEPTAQTVISTTHTHAETKTAEEANKVKHSPLAPRHELTTNAQGMIPLALETAVFMALQRNQELAMQRLNPDKAIAFVDIERGLFDPELFFSGSNESDSDPTETTLDTNLEGGIRKRFGTGTSVSLSGSHQREREHGKVVQDEARVSIGLTQALLRGFGPAVNLANLRLAKQQANLSHNELRGYVETLVANTEIAYWRLVLAKKRMAIVEASRDVAKLQAQTTKHRIDAGALAKSESAAPVAELARLEQSLIEAHSETTRLRLHLLRLIHPPQGFILSHPLYLATAPAQGLPLNADLETRIPLAHEKHAALNEANIRLQMRTLETTVTRNGLLPKLDFFANIGHRGYGNHRSGAWGDVDSDNQDYRLGIEFSLPLGNRSARARHRVSNLQLAQAKQAVANLKQHVEVEVRLAWNEVQRAARQIHAAAKTIPLQKNALRAEREKADAGQGTGLLVAQAQRDLVASQVAHIQALTDYNIAVIRLYLAEGSLLERRGITLSH